MSSPRRCCAAAVQRQLGGAGVEQNPAFAAEILHVGGFFHAQAELVAVEAHHRPHLLHVEDHFAQPGQHRLGGGFLRRRVGIDRAFQLLDQPHQVGACDDADDFAVVEHGQHRHLRVEHQFHRLFQRRFRRHGGDARLGHVAGGDGHRVAQLLLVVAVLLQAQRDVAGEDGKVARLAHGRVAQDQVVVGDDAQQRAVIASTGIPLI